MMCKLLTLLAKMVLWVYLEGSWMFSFACIKYFIHSTDVSPNACPNGKDKFHTKIIDFVNKAILQFECVENKYLT